MVVCERVEGHSLPMASTYHSYVPAGRCAVNVKSDVSSIDSNAPVIGASQRRYRRAPGTALQRKTIGPALIAPVGASAVGVAAPHAAVVKVRCADAVTQLPLMPSTYHSRLVEGGNTALSEVPDVVPASENAPVVPERVQTL